MENDRLLENSNGLDQVETNETGQSGKTAVPVGTPYGQLGIVLLILFCEPITAFMPMPFFTQVKPLISSKNSFSDISLAQACHRIRCDGWGSIASRVLCRNYCMLNWALISTVC